MPCSETKCNVGANLGHYKSHYLTDRIPFLPNNAQFVSGK